ncbi:hypothetical protein GCM10010406_21240 [Streptomyces thermolineatus]|uniref:Uncharacterized protein n=1 Tax=Streptomyces thermolineatus TaxID=44033 RepID=A0ABP5YPC3_9ACTN
MQMVRVTLYGGPLDGEQLDVPAQPDTDDPGIALPAAGCSISGGRSWYAPAYDGRWCWEGDTA